MAGTPANWDPQPWERIYVRSKSTGDLGWMVRRDGKDLVRLDRPLQEVIVEYSPDDWPQEVEYRPIPHAQLVRMCFEFDRLLLRALGDHERAKKEWHQLTDKQRVAWIESGPKNPPIRALTYKTIMAVLKEHLK